MLANANLISSNFSPFPLKTPTSKPSLKTQNPISKFLLLPRKASNFPNFLTHHNQITSISLFRKRGIRQVCQSSLNGQNSEDPGNNPVKDENGNGVAEGRDWTTSILLFLLWGALMYYVFNLTPNQTPSRDQYFVEKLLNLRGDDGFRMNQVLVALWYIMGLWPLVYTMLLIPTGRSSKSKIPVWPFVTLSCIGGAYALLPYFVLWNPPAPPVEETELKKRPLSVLESKLTASILLAAGTVIVIYAGIAGGADWKEFFQYFRESKFIHITCLDFTLLSTFAPFWVYNDMSNRKWLDRGSWLLPLSLVPFLGPAFYLVLRPSLSVEPDSSTMQTQGK